MTGQAVPCSGEATRGWYMGKERCCCMATAAPGALSREIHKIGHEQGSV